MSSCSPWLVTRAAKIARLTHRRLDYWAQTGLVAPSVDHKLSAHRMTHAGRAGSDDHRRVAMLVVVGN
jgi:hypothetical protein